MTSDQVEALLELVEGWARNSIEISALALIGSHARGAARPDSDVDLILLGDRLDALLIDLRWMQAFGDVESHSIEDRGPVKSVRVKYAGGLEVEFGFGRPGWATDPDEGTAAVRQSGLRVLFDREGIFGTPI